MKVVFLSDDFPPTSFGGAGISTYELALGVKEVGHDVSVITTCRKENEEGEADYRGLKVFKIASDYHERWRAWRSLYNPPVVRRVEKILKELRPDIVHANNLHYHLSYYCLKTARRRAKAVVWTARDAMAFSYGKLATGRYFETGDVRLSGLDNLRQAGRRYNPFRNICIRRLLRHADLKLAVSNALRSALEQNGIADVAVMRTGADATAYAASPRETEDFKRKHGLSDKRIVLFAGRLSEAKGGRKALEAMTAVAKEIPGAALLVAGGTDGYARLMEKEASLSGTRDTVVFTGWIGREEMKAAYAASDIVLIPSLCFDAFPRTVVEAMAAGKPVVATRYGGAPEIVVDGKTGYVVDPFDVPSLADKVCDLLRDREKAARFGAIGRERIQVEFNIGDKINQLVSRYRELVE